MKFYGIGLLLLFLFSISAKSQNLSTTGNTISEQNSDSVVSTHAQAIIAPDTLLARVFAQQPEYNTLSLRTRLIWDDSKEQQDFQGNIRMIKDSIIWVSLSGAMGVEGARVLLTPDTFKIINKLGNEYDIRPFASLRNWLLFPVSFSMLQQTLAGQKININETASAAFYQDSMYVLYCENDKLLQKIWVQPQHYTITKMLLKDKLLQQDMLITFDGYNDLNGKPFSYQRNVEINRSTYSVKLSIQVQRVGINQPVEFPFEISDRYKRVEK